MKLCIPSVEANGLESAVEPHFPNASHLVIFDTETRQHSMISVHEEDGQENTAIDAVLCGSINRMVLRNLLDQGIEVYGTPASSVLEAIGQFERGELEAVGVARGHAGHGHGHAQDEAHQCCGGQGHEESDHECCGGHNHDDDHECCGGSGHDDPDHECCGGNGHKHGHEHGHGHGGCGGHGRRHRGEGGCGCRD